MKDEKNIVVHLGLPKTGTTTIQNVFHAKRQWLLEKEGLLYPSLSPNLTNALCTMFHQDPMAHITNKMAGYTPEQIGVKQAEYLSALESEIGTFNWNTLLLSAEGLSNLNVPSLRRLNSWLAGFATSVRVVVCLRHPVAYTRSVIQQIMKGGTVLSELYERLPLPNFKGKLSSAAAVFGADAIQLYDFDSAANNPGKGIVAEFARLVGLSQDAASELAKAAVSDNEALSHEGVAILDGLNRIRPMFVDGSRNPARSGRELRYISRIRGAKFALPQDVEERIRALSRADVGWLNNQFGLELYRDVFEDVVAGRDRPVLSATSAEFFDSISDIIGELANPQVDRNYA